MLILVLCSVAIPHAENWPAWRGPAANSVRGETNLPVRWWKTENIAWRLALPEWSGSTAIIWGEHIFLNVAEGRDLSGSPVLADGRIYVTNEDVRDPGGKRF